VLGAALALSLPAFPCRRDKSPASPHGFRDATADPMGLSTLWERHPGPLVGVPTGEVSGLDVFDIDAPRHPEAAEWWGARRDHLPTTRTHRTRSGGLHLLFRHAPGMRCWAGRPVPGVDGRGDGGFAIWWPAAGLPVLCDAPPVPWPAWLLAELQPLPPVARPRSNVTIPDGHMLAGLVRKIAGAARGERNTLTFWAACRAGEMAASGLLTAETAAAIIARAATKSGLPPAEAERTAWSGVRTGLGSRAYA
jgi:hypothetical protein